MKLKKFTKQVLNSYPEEFTDWTDGMDVIDGEVQGFIKEGIERMKIEIGDDKATFFSTSTGNVIVFGEMYRQENGKFTINISVSKNYKSFDNYNIKL